MGQVIYSNASGLRSWTTSRKRRTGLNKAAGLIPAVAIARGIQNKVQNDRAANARVAKRQAGSTPRPRKPMRPKSKVKSPVKKVVNSMPVNTAYVKSEPVQQGMSKTMKIGLIVGGVLVVSVIAYLALKKK